MAGWNSRSVAVTVSTCSARQLDAPTSTRHALQPLGDEPRVAVARGIERRADHLQPLDPHVARLGRRERGELGRVGAHGVEHDARVRVDGRRRRRGARRAASRRPRASRRRAGPDSTPASTSASRSARFADRNHSDSWNTAVARVVERHAVAQRHPSGGRPAPGRWRRGRAACTRPGTRSTAARRRVRARPRRARPGSPQGSLSRRAGRSRSRPRTCGGGLRS